MINDTHVSANNPFINHEGPRESCQFHDCIGHRVRSEVLVETLSPVADVARLQQWMATATEEEREIAGRVARARGQSWAAALLEGR